MKLSNIQAQMLLKVLGDSLLIEHDFVISHRSRQALYKQIIEQQDGVLKDLEAPTSAEMQATGAKEHSHGLLGSWGVASFASQLEQGVCKDCHTAHAGSACDKN